MRQSTLPACTSETNFSNPRLESKMVFSVPCVSKNQRASSPPGSVATNFEIATSSLRLLYPLRSIAVSHSMAPIVCRTERIPFGGGGTDFLILYTNFFIVPTLGQKKNARTFHFLSFLRIPAKMARCTIALCFRPLHAFVPQHHSNQPSNVLDHAQPNRNKQPHVNG